MKARMTNDGNVVIIDDIESIKFSYTEEELKEFVDFYTCENKPTYDDEIEDLILYFIKDEKGIHERFRAQVSLPKINKRIEELKKQLSNSDYKIIKMYEAKLLDETMPYEIDNVISERQKIRDKINELELYL